jgi:hypothetical protein
MKSRKPKYLGKNRSQCHFVHQKGTGIKSVGQIRETSSSVTDIIVISYVHTHTEYVHVAHSRTDAICIYNINYLRIKQVNLDTVEGRNYCVYYVNTPIITFNLINTNPNNLVLTLNRTILETGVTN